MDKHNNVDDDVSVNSLFKLYDSQIFTQNDEQIFETSADSIIQPKAINVNNIIDSNKDIRNDVYVKDYRNKEDYVFDDYIDGDYTDGFRDKVRNVFGNKKFLMVVSILVFIMVNIVVYKAIYYSNEVDHYEEFFTVIENKLEDEVKVYKDSEIDREILGKEAATELISCINSSIDIEKLPDSINLVIDEINNYYNKSSNYFAFVYKDLFTGFTVSYNANQSIFAASTIKAPKDIYIYEMASQGKIDLDEVLTYTSKYYNTGSGVLKNKKTNTKYNVRELLEYSTVTSDNAAHNMLMDKYGRGNMLKFWKDKGTKTIFTYNNNWGYTSGNDAVIYMEELYKFYVNNTEYGDELMKNFINSYPKFLKGKNNYQIASKSGWSGSSIHDISIVFADNPYVVVALSNLGDTGYYTSYFNTVNDLAYKLHTEYWKYKMNICDDIRQY